MKKKVLCLLLTIAMLASYLFPVVVNADITTGLIGHWNFDEASGTTAANQVSGQPTGTLEVKGTGTAAFATGNTDKSLGNGVQTAATTVANFGIVGIGAFDTNTYAPGTGSFSVSFWYKPTVLPAEFLVGKGAYATTSAVTNKGWAISKLAGSGLNAGKIQVMIDLGEGGNAGKRMLQTNTIPLNTWAHIVFTINRTTNEYALYINGAYAVTYHGHGALEGDVRAAGYSSTLPGTLPASADILCDATALRQLQVGAFRETSIANAKTTATYSNGIFDELRIYDKALTTGDIIELSNGNLFDFAPGTPVAKAYGDAPFNIVAAGGAGVDPISYDITTGKDTVASITSGGLVTILSMGDFVVQATKGVQVITKSISVTARPLTVTANMQLKKIGSITDPSLTYNITAGSLAGADAITGSLSCTPGASSGEYEITVGTLTAGSNYNITFNSSNYTVYAMAGDANLDGIFSSADITTLQNHINSSALLTGDAFAAADLLKNGTLDNDDLTAMNNLLVDTRKEQGTIDVTGKKGNAEGKTNADYPSINRSQAKVGNGALDLPEPRAIIDTVNGEAGYFARIYGTKGAPIMLVHNNKGSGYLWTAIIEQLQNDYQLIVIDLPGDGYGPTRGAIDTSVSNATYCLDIATYLGVNNLAAAGQSFGGMVALEMYNQAPTRISEIILLDSYVAYPEGRTGVNATKNTAIAGTSNAATTARIADVNYTTLAHAWSGSFDSTTYFANITVPVLEVQSESEILQTDFDTWLATYRGSGMVPVKWKMERLMGSNAYVMFDKPAETVKLIDNFMKNNTYPASISFSNGIVSSNNICTGLTLNSTVLALKGNITPSANTTYKITDKDGVELADSAIISTGSKIDVYYGGNIVKTHTIIIFGDVDEDGDIKIADLASIKFNLLKMNTYSAAQQLAGDVTKNSTITISDLLAVKKHLINISTIVQ